MNTNLRNLKGNWSWGKALDLHTISSIPIMDENGEIVGWDTQRTETGEELYRLKYWTSESYYIKAERVTKIAMEISKVIADLKARVFAKYQKPFIIHHLIPIPPSKERNYQPVEELAKKVSQISDIPIDLDILQKNKSTSELKSMDNPKERAVTLSNIFDIPENAFDNQNVLLLDDLYRSGATLEAVTDVIKNKGKARNVLVITVTKTRSKR